MRALGSLKILMKRILTARQQRRYDKILRRESKDYHDWIRAKEKSVVLPEEKNAGNLSVTLLSFSLCGTEFYQKIADLQGDIIVFFADNGEPSELAVPLIKEFMAKHPDIILVYGDEDRIMPAADGQEIKRDCPWFKPDWSPDTFLSAFYFGSIFAARRAEVLAVLKQMQAERGLSPVFRQNLYELCYRLAKVRGGFDKMPPFEFETKTNLAGRLDAGWNNAPERFAVGHITEVLYHGRKEPELWPGSFADEYDDLAAMIGVVIPSKDHPETLERCIRSFIRHTQHRHYHFIIVDNGSSAANQIKIENFLDNLKQIEQLAFPPVYLYREMPFNFSRMCNMGAAAARPEAELLLFLNDDVEICQGDWLTRLAGKAVLPRVGAVGAKLLYPDSDLIQHAGVTNLRVGAAHMLQFLSDGPIHYFGKNRGVHNMLAVTGACLMVRKTVFTAVGGFCEELAVALNDVDLCYSLWEAGYVNVVINEIKLYHHESLSRGNDVVSEEKWRRFLTERDILFHRHRGSYGKDPYYHKYLATDKIMLSYRPAYCAELNPSGNPWAKAIPDRGEVTQCREDKVLLIGVEFAEEICRWKYGIPPEKWQAEWQPGLPATMPPEDAGYYIEGYSLVIDANNARYERILLLKERALGKIWQVAVETGCRPDIKENLTNQINVDLTGFSAKIRADAIPAGDYAIGMMVKDRCSRQRLVNWSERHLVVG